MTNYIHRKEKKFWDHLPGHLPPSWAGLGFRVIGDAGSSGLMAESERKPESCGAVGRLFFCDTWKMPPLFGFGVGLVLRALLNPVRRPALLKPGLVL